VRSRKPGGRGKKGATAAPGPGNFRGEGFLLWVFWGLKKTPQQILWKVDGREGGTPPRRGLSHKTPRQVKVEEIHIRGVCLGKQLGGEWGAWEEIADGFWGRNVDMVQDAEKVNRWDKKKTRWFCGAPLQGYLRAGSYV